MYDLTTKCNIIVKGFTYYSDNRCPALCRQYESLDDLLTDIKQKTIDTRYVRIPQRDGAHDVKFARCFAGHLSFPVSDSSMGYIDEHITTIEADGKIIYSSGELHHDNGFIGTRSEALFDAITTWTVQPDYAD